jgi:hypothetical protein
VNVLALVWGGTMLINFLWPRPASNPQLNTLPGLTGVGFLGNFPFNVFEGVVAVVVVVGAIYYLVAQRGKVDAQPAPREAVVR